MTDTQSEAGFQPFEGRPVVSSGIEMPGAGGGIHKALAVDNLELHHGETGTLAVSFEVVKVRHDRTDPDSAELTRIHVLKVTGAAQIPDDLVQDALDEQARRVEEARGIQHLPLGAEDPDADSPDAED